jgi:ABC-type sugar transport system ATPase subunit
MSCGWIWSRPSRLREFTTRRAVLRELARKRAKRKWRLSVTHSFTMLRALVHSMLSYLRMQPLAEMIEVTKRFDEVLALDRITLEFSAGEIVGLVGPNGSGKTTLMNVLCGALQPDSGEVWIKGKRVYLQSTADALARGVRLLSQSLQIYPSLTVLENIFLGQEMTRTLAFPKLMAWRRMEAAAQELLQRVGADQIDSGMPTSALSGGQQKAVALARLLARPGDLLIFDEPTASLGVRQNNRLLEVMKSEAGNGRALVFISHDIEDVLAVCDRVVGLRRGKVVSDQRREAVDAQSLAAQMSVA